MNIVTRLGVWIEKHFPEKMDVEDVQKRFSNYSTELELVKGQVAHHKELLRDLVSLAADFPKMKSDLNRLTTISAMKPSLPTIVPFATRRETAGGLSKK